jgi:hypothetical protein
MTIIIRCNLRDFAEKCHHTRVKDTQDTYTSSVVLPFIFRFSLFCVPGFDQSAQGRSLDDGMAMMELRGFFFSCHILYLHIVLKINRSLVFGPDRPVRAYEIRSPPPL